MIKDTIKRFREEFYEEDFIELYTTKEIKAIVLKLECFITKEMQEMIDSIPCEAREADESLPYDMLDIPRSKRFGYNEKCKEIEQWKLEQKN